MNFAEYSLQYALYELRKTQWDMEIEKRRRQKLEDARQLLRQGQATR